MSRFGSPADVTERLAGTRYLADEAVAVTVYLADRLEKPILCEGPAGVGKTELAKSLAGVTGHRLIRLQCYEGLDEAKALYEWNYKKQAPAHSGRFRGHGLASGRAGHLHRGLLARAAAAERDPSARARRAADRRGRPRRGGDRGAQLMGVDNRHVYALAVAIAFAIVALAGVLLGIRTTFSPDIGPGRLLFAFEAVVIVGLGSLWGTLAGGIMLGIAQAVGARIDPAYRELAGHLVFLAVLLVRPHGLFAAPRREA
jgi:Branched-chain amino acid transport system / permease component/AAA domain (dynein-related subfamily)